MKTQPDRAGGISRLVVKVGRSRQVVIPKRIWGALGLNEGDFFEGEEQEGGMVFTPKRLVDVAELIFWSKQSQAGLRQALEDVRKGRVSGHWRTQFPLFSPRD